MKTVDDLLPLVPPNAVRVAGKRSPPAFGTTSILVYEMPDKVSYRIRADGTVHKRANGFSDISAFIKDGTWYMIDLGVNPSAKKLEPVKKVIPDTCAFTNHVSVHSLVDQKIFKAEDFICDDLSNTITQDSLFQATDEKTKAIRSRVRRAIREWPMCHHGGTINLTLQFIQGSDNKQAVFRCTKCRK